MIDVWKAFANSRKAHALVAGILVILALVATGQIDPNTAANTIAGMISVFIGSIAVEDAAEKRGGGQGNVTVNAPQVKVEDSGGPVQ